ncbi:fl(2)d family protein [Abortiporus biennis]
MDLPSAREIELETLLRQRDAQIGELKDEVTQLRQHLSSQSPSTFSDPISLPPALISLLLPHIHGRSTSATATSQTVTTALTQRVKVLQEENDELYELLKTGETGRLKDDVHALKQVVQKLEGALKESHQAIASLSDELEKSQAAIMANARPNNYNPPPHQHQHQHQHSHQRSQLSHSPVSRSTHSPQNQFSSTNGSKKPVPTGPRAHKKPRLSEQYPSTTHSHSLAPPKMHRSQSSSTRRNESRERSPRGSTDRKTSVKMEIDEDVRPRSRSLERNRDSQRDSQRDTRDREKDRDRDSNKDRERDRSSRRNGGSVSGGGGGGSGGGGSGGGSGSGRRGQIRTSSSNTYPGGDRTLAERMGL